MNKLKENRYKKEEDSPHMRVFSVMSIALCFTLLFAGIGIASATTVYVATDGSGDYNCDGIDDQIEINAAIDYINSIGGGTVHLKRGTYIINNYVIMMSNVVLEGDDCSSTIVKIRDETTMPASDLSCGDLLMIYNSNQITNIRIQDIQLDANKRGNPTHVLHSGVSTNCIWLDSTYSTYKNVLFKDMSRDGIRLFGHHNDLIDCKGELIGHDAVRLTGNAYSNVIRFSMDWDDAPGNNIVRLTSCQYCVLDTIKGRGGDTAIQFQSSGHTDCNYNTLKNSILATDEACGYYGVVLSQDDSGSLTGNKIINTIIYDTDKYGLYIDGAENTEIENCVIYNSGYGGNGRSGIKIARGSGTTVKNSIVSNCGGYGIDGDAVSRYNDIWNNALGNYHSTSAGTGDISMDPLFAYPANRGFHLKSTFGRWYGSAWAIDAVTSPCIDAGDPSSDYANEPKQNNGGRINMGAYGNTGDASKSAPIAVIPGPDNTPPAIVSDLSTGNPTSRSITLTWTAPGDDGNEGSATEYVIGYLEELPVTESNWYSAIQCTDEPTPQIAGSTETFIVTGLSPNTTYYFAIKTVDEVPNTYGLSNVVNGTTLEDRANLVGYWTFDEGSGNTTYDSSGNSNNGSISGASWTDGKLGKALCFDGTNDYVVCGQDASLKITGAITVEAWVNWSGAGNQYFVTKTGRTGNRSYDLSGNTNGAVEFRVGGADCNSFKASGTAPIPTAEWAYIVGTYEPSSYIRLFVNGTLAKENTAAIPASQGDNGLSWYIGAKEGNLGWFNGIIDEVRIYDRALSAEEIRANYEASFPNQPLFTYDNPSLSAQKRWIFVPIMQNAKCHALVISN